MDNFCCELLSGSILKYRGNMRLKSNKIVHAVHQRLGMPCRFIGFVRWIVAIGSGGAAAALFLLNDCVFLYSFSFCRRVCAPVKESNFDAIQYRRILALLAYNFTLPYHAIHKRTHTPSIMYRMYTLIIIKPTCYIITAMQSIIYSMCVCEWGEWQTVFNQEYEQSSRIKRDVKGNGCHAKVQIEYIERTRAGYPPLVNGAQQSKCRVCARELHLNTVIALHSTSTLCFPYQFVSFARVAFTATTFHFLYIIWMHICSFRSWGYVMCVRLNVGVLTGNFVIKFFGRMVCGKKHRRIGGNFLAYYRLKCWWLLMILFLSK